MFITKKVVSEVCILTKGFALHYQGRDISKLKTTRNGQKKMDIHKIDYERSLETNWRIWIFETIFSQDQKIASGPKAWVSWVRRTTRSGQRPEVYLSDFSKSPGCSNLMFISGRCHSFNSVNCLHRLPRRSQVCQTCANWGTSMSDHTAYSLPLGSLKWNRRPPGNGNTGFIIKPPASWIFASVSSRLLL